MLRAPFLAVLAFFSVAICRADSLNDLVDKAMTQSKIPGLAVAIVKDGKVIREGYYGLSNLELQTKVDADTVFEIGSVSKQFTAMGVLMLAEEGKLSLDDPIGKYLDKTLDEWKPVTIRRALSHTAGMKEYLGLGLDPRKDYKPEDIVALCAKRPLDFQPGEAWSYSNSGYLIAGMLIEKVSGQRWAEFTQERILKPLGMTKTRIMSLLELIPGRAAGYAVINGLYRNTEPLRASQAYSAGAIVSTARDMAKWASALQNRKLLSAASYDAYFGAVPLSSGRKADYALGWFLDQAYGNPVIQHGGNTFGQSAQISLYPNDKLSVIVLSNRAQTGFVGLANRIARDHLAKVVVAERKVQPDPDKKRTFKVVDALNSIIRLKPDPELLDREMFALFETDRGRSSRQALRGQLGKVKALRYLDERKDGEDSVVWYELVGEKATIRIKTLISPEGKLVRMENDS